MDTAKSARPLVADMERAVCSWSGGKESALALRAVREGSTLSVATLVTFESAASGRTSYHGVRTELIERQADALGLDLELVTIPEGCTGPEYVDLVADVYRSYRERGLDRLVLGDVFLEDDDDYRGTAMERTGFRSFCPLFGTDTADLLARFLDDGFEARTVAVDAALGRGFLGRRVDRSFLADLPDDVDPAGEDGAYHTFVTDGPGFATAIDVETGAVRERAVGETTMLYCDLLPA
jgi:uncharacterized protein (TIGR00290 family)